MARRDALLRLHKTLMARRDELCRRLGGELDELRGPEGGESAGDTADMAFGAGTEEITSHLAELESRELHQIQKALLKLKQGTYGLCEGCQKKIPVARLNVLPFSTTCVDCQREIELNGGSFSDFDADWDKVSDSSFDDQRELDLSKIELDLSK